MFENSSFKEVLKKVIEKLIKVKNLNGTSDLKCTSCGSWIGHWMHKSKEKPDKCCRFGCNNSAEVGAHVKIVGSEDMHHYIVPLCKKCNSETEDFYVEKDTLVSARKCNSNN